MRNTSLVVVCSSLLRVNGYDPYYNNANAYDQQLFDGRAERLRSEYEVGYYQPGAYGEYELPGVNYGMEDSGYGIEVPLNAESRGYDGGDYEGLGAERVFLEAQAGGADSSAGQLRPLDAGDQSLNQVPAATGLELNVDPSVDGIEQPALAEGAQDTYDQVVGAHAASNERQPSAGSADESPDSLAERAAVANDLDSLPGDSGLPTQAQALDGMAAPALENVPGETNARDGPGATPDLGAANAAVAGEAGIDPAVAQAGTQDNALPATAQGNAAVETSQVERADEVANESVTNNRVDGIDAASPSSGEGAIASISAGKSSVETDSVETDSVETDSVEIPKEPEASEPAGEYSEAGSGTASAGADSTGPGVQAGDGAGQAATIGQSGTGSVPVESGEGEVVTEGDSAVESANTDGASAIVEGQQAVIPNAEGDRAEGDSADASGDTNSEGGDAGETTSGEGSEGAGSGSTESGTIAVDGEEQLVKIERVVKDSDLAIAAANVRKSWVLITPKSLDRLLTPEGNRDVGVPMRIAMMASVIANVVSEICEAENVGPFALQLPGNSLSQSKVDSPTGPVKSAGQVTPSGSFSQAISQLYKVIAQPVVVGQAQRQQYSPFVLPSTRRSNAYSTLWPGARSLQGLQKSYLQAPTTKDRYKDAVNARTVDEKITYSSTTLKEIIKQGQFSVPLIEAARLYLATLAPESQNQLMELLNRLSTADDAEFIQFKEANEVDPALEAGLLLLTRLQHVLSSGEV